jgi:hypothetical protein
MAELFDPAKEATMKTSPQRRHNAPLILLVICFFGPIAFAAEHDWRVGVASVDITPPKPMLMSGYANRVDPFKSVGMRLFAKAMAFDDGQGGRGVIVTADFIGFAEEVSVEICRKISDATGLGRESILLNASHTHNGPMVRRKVNLSLSEERHNEVAEYTDRLIDQIADAAIRALNETQPASLWHGRGVDNAVMNRREFTDGGIKLGVNPTGLADRSVPVLRVTDADGEVIAILFGAAAHNTTIKDERYQINGDYAGYAQARIEKALPGALAMFMLGCAGDTAPHPRGTVQNANDHGDNLGDEVLRVINEKMTRIQGPLRTALQRVDLPLQPTNPKAELEQIANNGPSYQKFYAAGVLSILKDGKRPPTVYNAPFAAWGFGNDLTFIGLSGETCVGYVELIERAIGHRRLWVAGYCNDLFGYLPTAQLLAEGGYETRGLYTSIGLFSSETEKVVVQIIRSLAQQVGRDLPDPP